jgi:tryptophan 2,3-dioxygenase
VSNRTTEYRQIALEDLNYNSYLRIPELLNMQQLQSQPPHHDEMFFIIIHQSFELWFKEMLHDTDQMVRYFEQGKVSRVLKVIKRINAIMACLCDQIQLLHTLTPAEFAGFRERLGTGSGFQSVQFREMEFAYGIREKFFLKFFQDDEFALERLQARLDSPSVYDFFLAALATDGYPVPAEILDRDFSLLHELNHDLVKVLHQLYEEADDNYHWILLCEALLDFDMLVSKWRSVHILMVSRTIGGMTGTGGSTGKAFLEQRLHHRFFPELWEVRNTFFTNKY